MRESNQTKEREEQNQTELQLTNDQSSKVKHIPIHLGISFTTNSSRRIERNSDTMLTIQIQNGERENKNNEDG